MTLFGEYNIGALYKETINVCLEDIQLATVERVILFAVVCLSDTQTGICYDPDTYRPAQHEDVFAYVAADKKTYRDAFAHLVRLEIVHLWTDRGKAVIILNEYLHRSLRVVADQNGRRSLIISKRRDEQHQDRGRQFGYVYLARAENGLYKIGKAKDPNERVRHFAGAVMPFVIELVHTIESNDALQAERIFHQRYQHCRRSGEWFQLSEDEVEAIMDIRQLYL